MEFDGLTLFVGSEVSGLTIPEVVDLPAEPTKGLILSHNNTIKIFKGVEWRELSIPAFPHIVTSGTETLNSGGGSEIHTGYWIHQDSYPELSPDPAPSNLGSIDVSTLFGTGIIVDRISITDLSAIAEHSATPYIFTVHLRGSELPQDLFTDINVKDIGKLLTSNTVAHGNTSLNNQTRWVWTITQQQYQVLQSSPTLTINFTTPVWYDPAKRQAFFAPAYSIGELTYQRTGFRDFSSVPGILYDSDYGVAVGTMLNRTVGSYEIKALETHDQDTGFDSDDRLYFHLDTENVSDSAFGALIIPALGTFTPNTAEGKSVSGSGTTFWYWNIAYFSKHTQAKNAGDLPSGLTEFEVDERPFVPTHTITCSTGFFNPQTWKGYSSLGNVLGSINTTSMVNGNSVVAVMVNENPSSDETVWEYILNFRIAGDNKERSEFEYIDVEGLGRFYSKDSGRYLPNPSQGFTQFHWAISQARNNYMPSSGTLNVQIA